MSAHLRQSDNAQDAAKVGAVVPRSEHIDLVLAWSPLVLGFLFFLLPPLLGFAGGTREALTSYAFGAFVGALGILMRIKVLSWDGAALLALGIAAALSPFVQGFSVAALGFWTLLLLGLVTAAVGFATLYRRRG